MDINQAVVCLANWRAETKRLQDAQAAMRAAVTESLEYKRLGEEFMHAHQMESETEDAVRTLAVDEYEKTHEKQVHDAVVVKFFDVVEYNQAEALEYCRAHLPSALKLDAKKFEAAAKAIGLPFVLTVATPKATIATDLSAYL